MNTRISNLLWIVLPMACALSAPGCGGADAAQEPNPIPVIPVALTRSYTANQGLVTGWGAHDWPLRDQESDMDPIITEGRRFYDTLQAPNAEDVVVDYPDPFTGAPPAPKKTAPLTLDAWKAAFNIPVRNPGESLADYRVRTNAIVYYNKNELGLGRELGCGVVDYGRRLQQLRHAQLAGHQPQLLGGQARAPRHDRRHQVLEPANRVLPARFNRVLLRQAVLFA